MTMKWIHNSYIRIISFLRRNAIIAFFLSHGAVHICALFFLFIFILFLYNKTHKNEIIDFYHIKEESVIDLNSIKEVIPLEPIDTIGDSYNSLHDFELLDDSFDKMSLYKDKDGVFHFFTNTTSVYQVMGLIYNLTLGNDYIHCNSYVWYKKNPELNITDSRLTRNVIKVTENNGQYLELDSFPEYYDCPNKGSLLNIMNADGSSGIFHPDNIPSNLMKDSVGVAVDVGGEVKRNKYIYETPISKDEDVLYIPYSIKVKKFSHNSPTTALFYELSYLEDDTVEFTNSRVEIVFGKQHNYIGNDVSFLNEDLKPFEIKYAYPQPDEITPFSIAYNRPNSISSIIKNNGFYIIVEDVVAKNKANRISLQYTVLIGAIIAFMLDILVNLILKWRRLAKSQRQSSHNRINTRKRKKRI